MKKLLKLCVISFILSLFSFSLFAQEEIIETDEPQEVQEDFSGYPKSQGIFFGTDFCVGINPLLAEDVFYKYQFDNGIALDAGIRVSENFIARTGSESLIYLSPIIDFNYKGFYIGGGPLLEFIDGKCHCTFIARTGGNFGNWTLGRTKLNVRAGFEFSPTLNDPGDDNPVAETIGLIFLSVLNIPKIDLGVTCYLPF